MSVYQVAGNKEENERERLWEEGGPWDTQWRAVRVWARREGTPPTQSPFSRALPLAPALLKPRILLGKIPSVSLLQCPRLRWQLSNPHSQPRLLSRSLVPDTQYPADISTQMFLRYFKLHWLPSWTPFLPTLDSGPFCPSLEEVAGPVTQLFKPGTLP